MCESKSVEHENIEQCREADTLGTAKGLKKGFLADERGGTRLGGIGFRRTDHPFFRFVLGNKTTKKIRANAATGPNTPLPNTGHELTEIGAEEALQLPAFLADHPIHMFASSSYTRAHSHSARQPYQPPPADARSRVRLGAIGGAFEPRRDPIAKKGSG